jgi:hypothetical protein
MSADAARAFGPGARHFADTAALIAALGEAPDARHCLSRARASCRWSVWCRRWPGRAPDAAQPVAMAAVAVPQRAGLPARLPVPDLPRRAGGDDGLLIGLAFGPWVIRRLTALKIGQPIREYGVQSHLAKRGTPTMGGVLILIGIGVSTLLWFDWSNRFVWIVMLVTFGFGAIGWVDDWRKVVQKNPEGMRSAEKYFWQSVIGLIAALYLAFSVSETSNLRVLELFLRWVTSGFSNSTCRPRPT